MGIEKLHQLDLQSMKGITGTLEGAGLAGENMALGYILPGRKVDVVREAGYFSYFEMRGIFSRQEITAINCSSAAKVELPDGSVGQVSQTLGLSRSGIPFYTRNVVEAENKLSLTVQVGEQRYVNLQMMIGLNESFSKQPYSNLAVEEWLVNDDGMMLPGIQSQYYDLSSKDSNERATLILASLNVGLYVKPSSLIVLPDMNSSGIIELGITPEPASLGTDIITVAQQIANEEPQSAFLLPFTTK